MKASHISGYAEDAIVPQSIPVDQLRLQQKPSMPTVLASKIRDVLNPLSSATTRPGRFVF